ncbi:hypothetical protein SAMD00019534_081580, partial [Acytostelium subglobosum LB1]|uniref:hypothetical protein n=1 Tax=Acytostelium subglobosum LB1 TaxID=1410327 RepID=UPI0006451F5A
MDEVCMNTMNSNNNNVNNNNINIGLSSSSINNVNNIIPQLQSPNGAGPSTPPQPLMMTSPIVSPVHVRLNKCAIDTDEEDGPEDTVGISMYGNGIRATSFASGVLARVVERYDNDRTKLILSCVSGGGVLGSAFCQRVAKEKARKNQVSRVDIYKGLDEDMRKNIAYCVNFGSVPRMLMDIFMMIGMVAFQLALIGMTVIPFIMFLVETMATFYHYVPSDKVWILAVVGIGLTVTIFALSIIFKTISVYGLYRAPFIIFNWFKVLTFLCALFTVLVGSQAGMDRIETAFGDWVAGAIGLSITAFWAIFRFHPFFFIEQWIENLINSLTGYVALLSIYGIFMNWRLGAVASDTNLLFGHIMFTDYRWSVVLITTIVLIGVYPATSYIADNHIHAFYRWRLQRAFYKTDHSGFDGIFGIYPGTKFTQLDDSATYVSTMTANHWQLDPGSSPISSLSIGKWLPGIDTNQPTNDINPLNEIRYMRGETNGLNTSLQTGWMRDLEISFAMINSGGSLTSSFGSDAKFKTWENFFSLFNLGFGTWTNMNYQKDFKARSVYITMTGMIPFLIAIPQCFVSVRSDYPWVIWIPCVILVFYFLIADHCPSHWASTMQNPIVRVFRDSLSVPIVTKYGGYIYLSDGSHSENTGLFVLLANKAIKTIFIADGSEDVDRVCSDLRKTITEERAFGWDFFTQEGHDIERELIEFQRDRTVRHIAMKAINEKEGRQVNIYFLKPIERANRHEISGVACECCHASANCCTCLNGMISFPGDCFNYLFGRFPNTSSYYQLFTPTMYDAYRSEGVAAFDSVQQLKCSK